MEIDNNTVYLSYYNNKKTRSLPLERISISLSTYEKDIKVDKDLAPPYSSFQAYKGGLISFEELIDDFIQMKLMKLNPEEIFKKYKGRVLLCHEVEDCHRFVVKEWLETHGYKCIELPR